MRQTRFLVGESVWLSPDANETREIAPPGPYRVLAIAVDGPITPKRCVLQSLSDGHRRTVLAEQLLPLTIRRYPALGEHGHEARAECRQGASSPRALAPA